MEAPKPTVNGLAALEVGTHRRNRPLAPFLVERGAVVAAQGAKRLEAALVTGQLLPAGVEILLLGRVQPNGCCLGGENVPEEQDGEGASHRGRTRWAAQPGVRPWAGSAVANPLASHINRPLGTSSGEDGLQVAFLNGLDAVLFQHLVNRLEGRVFGIQELDADELAILVQIYDQLCGDSSGARALLARLRKVQIAEARSPISVADLEINVFSAHHHPISRKQ